MAATSSLVSKPSTLMGSGFKVRACKSRVIIRIQMSASGFGRNSLVPNYTGGWVIGIPLVHRFALRTLPLKIIHPIAMLPLVICPMSSVRNVASMKELDSWTEQSLVSWPPTVLW